ncbi:hypothetical protein ACSSS7_000881 [Eimeria intestinalis]
MSAADAVEHGADMASSLLEDVGPRRSWRLSALPPATLSIEGPSPPPPNLPAFSHGVRKGRPQKANERKSAKPPRRGGSRLVPVREMEPRVGLEKGGVVAQKQGSVAVAARGFKTLDIRDLPQPPQMILHPVVILEPSAVEGICPRHLALPDTLHWMEKWRAKVEEDVGRRLAPLPALPNRQEELHTTAALSHPPPNSGSATCSIAEGQSRTDTYLRLDGFVERRRPAAFVPAAPARAMTLPMNVPLSPLPPPEPPKQADKTPTVVFDLPPKEQLPPPSPPPPPPPPIEPVITLPFASQPKVEPVLREPEPEPKIKPSLPPQEEAPLRSLLPRAPEVEAPTSLDVATPDEPPASEIPAIVTPVEEPPAAEQREEEKKEEAEVKEQMEEPEASDGGVVLSGGLTEPDAPFEQGGEESMVVNPIEAAAGEPGPENDGCDLAGEQLDGSGDDVMVTPQAVVECKRIIQKWTKASIRISRIQRMYYKFGHAFKAGVVKTRTYCVVFHDGEDLDYVSLLTSHRTEIARPQNDSEFPKSRINCNFTHSVILPFDASSPVLRIAVVLVMAKKDEQAETGEFMRRVAGVTKPLNVERYRERMAEMNAWPLYVPQEVMGSTAVENPTLVGLVYFALTGHAGAEGPQLVPDRVLSASFDFHAGRPKEAESSTSVAVEIPPKKVPWYELLNPFKPHKKEPEKSKEPPEPLDSMARIPLPSKHKPEYLQLLAAFKKPDDHKPQIALHSIKTVGPVKATQSFEEGSLQPPPTRATKSKTNRAPLAPSTSSVREQAGGSSLGAFSSKEGKGRVFPAPPPANSSSASLKKSVSKFGPASTVPSRFAAASRDREKSGSKTERTSLIVKGGVDPSQPAPPKAGLTKLKTTQIDIPETKPTRGGPTDVPKKRSYLQAASSAKAATAKAGGARVRIAASPRRGV